MAIDRGSLDYRIRVSDAYSRPIQRFRRELLKARNTALAVKQDLAGVNASIAAVGTASARAGAKTVALTADQRAHWKAVQDGARRAATAQRLRARANKDIAREEIRRLKAGKRALEAREKAEKRAADARKRAAREAEAAARRAVINQRRLGRELDRTKRKSGQLFLAFKRLAGVFVGFQIIRFGVDSFREMISMGIRFNRVMEDSRIGIAAMIGTLAGIPDAQGKPLEGAQKFNAALVLTDSILEKIRKRSLATTATFPQLIEAFQAGVAPGLEAGVSIEDIILITERISQAAAGLRIQQNQLNEEIRSLLRGTAQARTSLVASILFGGAKNANELIREAKRVGKVGPVIIERLKLLGIA
ncbi:hypothetical protein LCGC14_2221790, partial [marine sediment metagenome]